MAIGMGGHEKSDDRAQRRARADLSTLGRELREARLDRGLSQGVAAQAIGVSPASWSRLERGEAPGVSLVHVARALAVVGLDLRVRTYPGGQPVRDQAHLLLLQRLQRCLGPGARWQTEVPLPLPGDQRAWDALIVVDRVRVGVEAETRVRDMQELERRIALKRRDGAVDHVILLLAATRHNRRVIRAHGERLQASFPVLGRSALERLALPADPGGSAVILL